MLVVFVVGAFAYAAGYKAKPDWQLYGGISMQQSSVSGLKNARLSDVQYYGSSEGSLYLPLEQYNGDKPLIGGVLGGRVKLTDQLVSLAEIDATFGGAATFAVNINLGGIFYFVNKNIHLGAGAKVGIYDYNVALGQAEILPGTTPPVILPEGTIYNGDTISYSILGLSLNPFIDFNVDMGAMAIGASVGYQIGFSFKSSLDAKHGDSDSISIDPETSGAYYDPEKTTITRIEMNPKVSLNGVTVQVYIMYKM